VRELDRLLIIMAKHDFSVDANKERIFSLLICACIRLPQLGVLPPPVRSPSTTTGFGPLKKILTTIFIAAMHRKKA
jgi:hypothetical protein